LEDFEEPERGKEGARDGSNVLDDLEGDEAKVCVNRNCIFTIIYNLS